jgi:uroporphyrin-III C-methyltransferase/precorrin-2 dehydrogenase/sirohydrochlorin ferrochelatase
MAHSSPFPPVGPELLPLFLRLAGRRVLVVGGGRMAALRVEQLVRARAEVLVVAPEVLPEIAARAVRVERRPFAPGDLDGAWLAIAAATPEVNRAVGAEAERRRIFVNAVDDPSAATAYSGGVIRRGAVSVALSTDGRAPALAGLLREGIEALLPEQVPAWLERAEALRARWKAERVPMGERRPLLLRALNELYGGEGPPPEQAERPPVAAERRGGFVSIVGAGPGDPGLLTLKARQRLEEADLVLYDALVSPEVLAHAGRARRFLVGKRAGRPSVKQRAIHRLLIRAARAGQRVVRLKAGDPFVFGRGGEEALILAVAGIPHEVVPGVSSALAAPALAGIPVTHRGLAASFTVVSGHAEEAYRPVLEGLPPSGATLVVLMGIGTRARIAEILLGAGWPAETPVAALFGASTPSEARWHGTLDALAGALLPEGDPGTLVIGAVAGLAAPAIARSSTASE